MPLGEPPAPADLRRLRRRTVRGTLYRIVRQGRGSPWWFASIGPGDDPDTGGRFDLPHPDGACYTGTTAAAATLEAFQEHARGVIHRSELARRQVAAIECSPDAPAAANLTANTARALGVTQALWADNDRGVTQRWAAALRRAGWLAVHHGIQHDTTGRLRAVTLFDTHGEHVPYDDAAWGHTTSDADGDPDVEAALHRAGFTIVDSDPNLGVVHIDDYLAGP